MRWLQEDSVLGFSETRRCQILGAVFLYILSVFYFISLRRNWFWVDKHHMWNSWHDPNGVKNGLSLWYIYNKAKRWKGKVCNLLSLSFEHGLPHLNNLLELMCYWRSYFFIIYIYLSFYFILNMFVINT